MKKKYNKVYLYWTFCFLFVMIFINSGCKQHSPQLNDKTHIQPLSWFAAQRFSL